MSYSSSNHSASGRSVKFRDLEVGAGDASGSRTSSKMSAALSFDASVGLFTVGATQLMRTFERPQGSRNSTSATRTSN